jgi:hypothetical protein
VVKAKNLKTMRVIFSEMLRVNAREQVLDKAFHLCRQKVVARQKREVINAFIAAQRQIANEKRVVVLKVFKVLSSNLKAAKIEEQ